MDGVSPYGTQAFGGSQGVNQSDAATQGAPQGEAQPPANPVFKSLTGSVAFTVLVRAVRRLAILSVTAVMQKFTPPGADRAPEAGVASDVSTLEDAVAGGKGRDRRLRH